MIDADRKIIQVLYDLWIPACIRLQSFDRRHQRQLQADKVR